MFRLPVEGQLEIRAFEELDAQAVYSLVHRNRLRLRRWLPWIDATGSPEDTLEFIRQSVTQYFDGSGLHCGLWWSDRVVGGIGLRVDQTNRSANLGYWLDVEEEGKGFVTRGADTLVRYAFSQLELHRIEIRCHPDNHRSRAIPERLGFQQEGLARGALRIGSEFQDLIVYGRLASDRISS